MIPSRVLQGIQRGEVELFRKGNYREEMNKTSKVCNKKINLSRVAKALRISNGTLCTNSMWSKQEAPGSLAAMLFRKVPISNLMRSQETKWTYIFHLLKNYLRNKAMNKGLNIIETHLLKDMKLVHSQRTGSNGTLCPRRLAIWNANPPKIRTPWHLAN